MNNLKQNLIVNELDQRLKNHDIGRDFYFNVLLKDPLIEILKKRQEIKHDPV
jgi:hypothetical protein